jgi:glutamate dehydrogenase/leucine dehydrogenase
MNSIFDPLVAEGWTSLKIRHDWRTGVCAAVVSREWEPELEFSRYGSLFHHETLLSSTCAALDAPGTEDLFRRHGRLEELQHLFGLLRQGRHEGMDCWLHAARNIRFVSNIHSSVPGLGNGRHALRAGGIRRHDFDDPEGEVLIDGLNLARGMSFKNVAAQIPYGGCKTCVHAAPVALDDMEALGFLAFCIDRGRFFTGPDMGFSPEHADVLRQHFTRNIVGGLCGALGPTGTPTAQGVFLAIIEAARFHLQRKEGLTGLTVAVQGLGAVGAPLARRLLSAGIERLTVADTDRSRLDAFAASLAADERSRVAVVSPGQVLFVEADLVSPNAVGSVFGPEEIRRLRCRIVMGAANNQLRAVSQEAELALAEELAARGVLYQVDWMHNTAGVIAGMEEWENQEQASMERVTERLERVCRDGVRANLEEAREQGLTPTTMAYRRIEDRIYPR